MERERFGDLLELAERGIREAFGFYGVSEEITESYLSESLTLCLGADRSAVVRLNRLARELKGSFVNEPPKELVPKDVMKCMNHYR